MFAKISEIDRFSELIVVKGHFFLSLIRALRMLQTVKQILVQFFSLRCVHKAANKTKIQKSRRALTQSRRTLR